MLRLRALRVEKGLSGQALCRIAVINPSTLSQIERGRFQPYESQLVKLAEALEYAGEPAELLEEV
jgi:transcriptional regulator with XRE-family HTH domain